MLSYHESVEVAKFQQSASREKASFVSLIQKKAHLVLPIDEVRRGTCSACNKTSYCSAFYCSAACFALDLP
jgi:RNase P subunit RPR2